MIAGDIFDKWKVSPQTVNNAIEMFYRFDNGVYAIPGQHDLRHHNYADIKETSYWTLVKAKVIHDLRPDGDCLIASWNKYKPILVHPFPWGRKIVPNPKRDFKAYHIAVVHKYVWTLGCEYPGAAANAHVTAYRKALTGYTAAFFGDNHKGFCGGLTKNGKVFCPVINCGTFMHRKSDEKDYEPCHGVLYEDGSVMYTSNGFKAEWVEDVIKEVDRRSGDVESLLEILTNLGEQSLDFREAVERYMVDNNYGSSVKKLVLEAME